MSRILFLGTAGTFDALKNTGRSSGGILIEVDDSQIIINPGIGTIIRSSQFNADISKTDIVLLSSASLIDSNDLNAVAELSKQEKYLVCNKDILKHEDSVLTKNHLNAFSKVFAETHSKITINNIDIEILKSKSDKLLFKIYTSKFVLGYVSAGNYPKSLAKEFKESNILILDCSEETDKRELVEFIEEIDPELAIPTNFNEKIIKEDPLEYSRNLKKILQAGKKLAIRTQIIPAKEGMSITPESYNIKVKQKKLEKFF